MFTIITFVLACVGIAVSANGNSLAIILTTLGSLFVGILMDSLAKTAKKRGANVYYKLLYIFSKSNEDYKITKKTISYQYLSLDSVNYRNDCECVCTNPKGSRVEQMFRWAGDAYNSPKIVLDTNNTVTELTKSHRYDAFIYKLPQFCEKKESFNIGYTIYDLKDTYHKATYIESKIRFKTKFLYLEVLPAKDMCLYNVKLIELDKNNKTVSTKDTIIHTDGYKCSIQYPRRGHTYILDWSISPKDSGDIIA